MNREKIVNWAIALGVAAVYLMVSIAFSAWAYSWMIWIAYAGYRFMGK